MKSSSFIQEHLKLIGTFAGYVTSLRAAGMKFKHTKCYFFQQRVKYLGHIISEAGIEAVPDKIECVKSWPLPATAHEFRQFLGWFFDYYCRFVKDYAHICKSLHTLLKRTG